jgi:uncharacterized membrane protein
MDTGLLNENAPPLAAAPVGTGSVVVEDTPLAVEGYPSLYDTKGTTVVAILLGVAIIAAIQVHVARMFSHAKNETSALAQFVMSMMAIIIGVFVVDTVISGPDTSLLSASEKASVMELIRANVALVFGYYFGSKVAQAKTDSPQDGDV